MEGFPSEAGPLGAALAGGKRSIHNHFTIFENRKTTEKLANEIGRRFVRPEER
jgi:hypothetical protein